jgi:hypothetical protein
MVIVFSMQGLIPPVVSSNTTAGTYYPSSKVATSSGFTIIFFRLNPQTPIPTYSYLVSNVSPI